MGPWWPPSDWDGPPSSTTACQALSGQRVYELWYSRNGTMVPAGLVEPGRSTGTMLLTGGPQGADGVGVTAEPPGGSSSPTSAPLGLLRV